ncbi:FkbM family methyltransferase [Leptospira borgpetersenii]|uniref:Methyltransferase FkbM domain protein n=1 Tax=Leptospira borgpetersenii str. 200801926 TaxID=1193009 RepID=A0ABP2RYT7_LEPBO|nr:FkbM family methyltransferase [Leptospira borgpetersenii]EKP12124.1 methyltransferase FkbM domain protein [Leptospira borgpetersenii str. 200801926]ENO64384.1 methyltransferase FkbM domain protein [Leptospira borgpetersenii serovar Mini str. 201000851]
MITDKLLKSNPLVIADVGASGGMHPRWEKFTTCYKGILFEPDPREYEQLIKQKDTRILVIGTALSDSKQEISFNLCRRQQVSSAYLPNLKFLQAFPDAERYDVERTIKIKTDSIDFLLKDKEVRYIDFLKVDTQGLELSILKGASHYLNDTIGLQIEIEFVPMYLNQPLFPEVDEYIRTQGFTLFDLQRYYWKRKDSFATGIDKGQLIFCDTLYFKTPESILSAANLSNEKLVRTICIYLVYGYTDLAQVLFNEGDFKKRFDNVTYNLINKLIAKQKKWQIIPRFRGKGYLRNILQKITNVFEEHEWYSGSDKNLGNL